MYILYNKSIQFFWLYCIFYYLVFCFILIFNYNFLNLFLKILLCFSIVLISFLFWYHHLCLLLLLFLLYFSFTDSIENFMFFSLFWALLWIGFLWLGYKLWKSNSLIVDWYRILTNWKYKWDWSNWSANWNWEFILSDWTVLKWLFKNWKLNWKMKG